MYYSGQKNVEDDEKISQTLFRIAPKAGYFLTDKMAVGAQVGFSISNDKREDENTRKDIESEVFFAPFARYYLTSGTVGFFAEGSLNVGFGGIKRTYDYADGDNETEKGNITSFSLGISPGIYYYIKPKIALELSLGWMGYNYRRQEFDGETIKTSRLGFDFDTMGLSCGATFTL
jgi:outer membrane protein